MAYIAMAYIAMAYIAMAYIAMAYIVMAYIVMAYIPPPGTMRLCHISMCRTRTSSVLELA